MRPDLFDSLIAGPCSAETHAQIIQTAEGLKGLPLSYFRAGIWKPRTQPGAFEGIGDIGLEWLVDVRNTFGYKICTEVATAEHVKAAIAHQIDMVWIGARSTVNPFTVQEIAEALQGSGIPVMVKNPVNPDLKLWIGAIERLERHSPRFFSLPKNKIPQQSALANCHRLQTGKTRYPTHHGSVAYWWPSGAHCPSCPTSFGSAL